MSNGEHEIRTPKGLRIGNRSVVDGKNMLQIKRGGCEDYISAESLVERINAINNLDQSFADNRPKALVQMATGAGKTFTAITAAYRLLKYGNVLKSGMR